MFLLKLHHIPFRIVTVTYAIPQIDPLTLGRGQADAAAAAGDDSNFSIQFTHLGVVFFYD